MAKLRPLVPVAVGVLVGSAALFLLLRGFRDTTGVPDTSSTVGEVTSAPDPRPSSSDPDGPMTADGSDPDTPDDAGDPVNTPTAVRGTVVDDTERPIAGARLELRPVHPQRLRGAPFPDEPAVATATSDRDGSFRLAAAAGTWLRLVGSAEGHATVGILLAGTGSDVVLRLPPSGMLSVSVMDTGGRPVGDAFVEAHIGQTLLRAETNADGLAAFGHLPPGDAIIRAGSERHGTVRAGPVRIEAGATQSLDVTLTAGVKVAGSVLDAESGRAIAGASVRVARPGKSTDAGTTNADGRFAASFAGGVGERVFLSVQAEGYAPALEPVLLRPVEGDLQTTVIRLHKAEPWSGEVLFPVGVPIVPIRVAYTGDGVAGREATSTMSDANGRFELPPPPPPAPGRRVVLIAEGAGLRAAVALRPGQLKPRPLLLRLVAGATVRGRVLTRDGEPAAGALVRLVPNWTRGSRATLSPQDSLLRASNERGLADLTAATDDQGRWEVRGAPEAAYELFITWQGADRWTGRVVEVKGRTDAGTVRVGTGVEITGSVRDVTGRDVAGANVRLYRAGERVRATAASTDTSGSFRFTDLIPARYTIRVRLAGYGESVAELTLEEGGAAPDPIDFRLEPSGALEGLLRRGGATYRGAFRIHLRRPGRGGAAQAPITLRTTNGRFRVPLPGAGSWTLRITADDGLVASSPDVVDANPGEVARVELDLIAGAGIAGRVTGGDDLPVGAARVTLTHETSGLRHLTTAMEDGRYAFRGLDAGAYLIRADGSGGVPVERRLVLDTGRTEQVDLEMPEGGHARVIVVDEKGRRVAGAILLFRGPDRAYPGTPPDRTDVNGVAARRHLPSGPMQVGVRVGDREGTQPFDIVEGKTVEITLEIRPRDG